MSRQSETSSELASWRIVLSAPAGYYDPAAFSIDDAVELLTSQHIPLSSDQRASLAETLTGEEPWATFDWSERQRSAVAKHLVDREAKVRGFEASRDRLIDFVRVNELASISVAFDRGELPRLAEFVIVAPENQGDAIATIFPECDTDTDAGFGVWRYNAAQSIVSVIDKSNALKSGGQPSSHLPLPGEVDGAYMGRVQVDPRRLTDAARAFAMLGGDLATVARYFDQRRGERPAIEWAVDGLIPRSALSVMVGAPKIGKSTIALQIARDVALGAPVFGQTVPAGTGIVLFISGEDSEAMVLARLDAMMEGAPAPDRLICVCEPRRLSEVLAAFDRATVDFVVVDTAAHFVEGSISDGGHVRNFMSTLDSFLKTHNAAGLVIHHVNKGKAPRSAEKVIAQMKGSGEFLSAARLFLAFYETGARRVLQVARDNMPPGVTVNREPIPLAWDAETALHAVADPGFTDNQDSGNKPSVGAGNAIAAAAVDADAEVVATVIARAVGQGRSVALSGKNEPHTFRAQELAGWPRTRVRAAHARAIALGKVPKSRPLLPASDASPSGVAEAAE